MRSPSEQQLPSQRLAPGTAARRLSWILTCAFFLGTFVVTGARVRAEPPAVIAPKVKIKKHSGPGELPPPMGRTPTQQQNSTTPPVF